MKRNSGFFKVVDCLYIAMMVLPILVAIVIKIITNPASSGISITGANVFFSIPMPLQDLLITESQVNSLAVMISILGLCLYLTHGIGEDNLLVRHHVAEFLVEKARSFVVGNMGEYFYGFTPFVVSILGLSAFSSLISLCGLYPPTSDVNIVGGWAILVFVLITYYKFKCGPVQYIKAMADPVLLAPINLISELATPISMAFRHYGNVLSGVVVSVLVTSGLQKLSAMVFGFLPGFLGEIPFLQVGIPAVLSIYFDLFSGCLQAYIFAMLTMLYIATGFPEELYMKRKKLKNKNNKEMVGGI